MCADGESIIQLHDLLNYKTGYHILCCSSFTQPDMPDLLILLPPEIVTNIISYISQSDCIECLRVCHRWHDVISTHSQQVWRHLTLVEEALVIDGCMTKCLPHVQEVTFKGFRPYIILKRLADLTCNITFLGRQSIVMSLI